MSYLRNRKVEIDIRISIDRLFNEKEQSIMADIFDRIAAALTAIQQGNNTALQAHVAEIDSHLSNVDASVLGLQSDDTSSKARLDAIEAGLGKIADTVNPPSSSGSGSAPAGGSSTPPASDGSQSGDVSPTGSAPAANPGESAPIPASGPGSESTGQVDTPNTSA